MLCSSQPWRLPLNLLTGKPSLQPLEDVEVPLIVHASDIGDLNLQLMFVYREVRA